MPFTPAHIAAVLPAVNKPRPWVVPVAWVVGSMVPDIAWFVLGIRAYDYAHTLAGVLTLDVALGVLLVMAWRFVVVSPTRDVLPAGLGGRVPDSHGIAPREWPLVGIGLVAGALTHVVWDAFTHPGRWGTQHIDLLARDIGPLPGYRWAQYFSGVLGLAAVAVFLIRRMRAEDARPVLNRRASPTFRVLALASVILIPLACAGITWVLVAPASVRAGLVVVAARTILAFLLSVLGASAMWWLLPRTQSKVSAAS